MIRIGVLDESNAKLDYVLGLTLNQFLDRRLQTIVNKTNNAKSIHHSRTLIFQRKIVITQKGRKQIVDIPSFIVRKDNESHILNLGTDEINENSRTRKRTKKRKEEKANKGGDDDN